MAFASAEGFPVIQIIVLLYAGEGGKAALTTYQEEVMPIFHEHGGRLVSASHASEPRDDDPDEVHIVHFSSLVELEAFRADPRHAALKEKRMYAVRDTRLYQTDQFVTYID